MRDLKIVVFIFLITIGLKINLNAANYYFSASTGSDAFTAVQAQNQATPWKTLTKLNAIIGTLLPGDSVLFKRGDTFYGSFTVNVSGTSVSPIVFGAYGTGAKPIISGLTALTTWTAQGINKWEADCQTCGSSLNMLLFNDTIKHVGRYPNYNSTNKGYLNFESHVNNTQITDNELTNTPNWTGGELVIRKNHWIIDRDNITNHLNSTLSYTTLSVYSPIDNWGYFIQNHPSALDQHGEWYFNSSTKKILIYSNTTPTISTIAVTTIDTLIVIKNANYIVLTNLFIKGSNKLSCGAYNSNYINIINCDIKYSGQNGFWSNDYHNCNFENNTINFTNNNGYTCKWGQNNTIKNNVIKNTATIPGIGKNEDGNYFGMYVDGNNTTISLNTIDSVGYVALAFGSNGTIVKNNFINNYDLVKADGGGIYTFKGCSNVTYTGRNIIGNIILNGRSTSEGTDVPNTLSGEGIYLDDNSDGVDIIGNTVANCGNTGIFLHNTHEINVKNNTVYNCGSSQLYLSEQHLSCTPNLLIRNNIIKNNILFSRTDTQLVSNLYTTNNDISLFGIFDTNYYCRPLNQETIINTNYISKDLPQWQTEFNKDPNSSAIPILFSPYVINSTLGTNSFTNGTFNSNINNVTCFSTGNNCNNSWDNSGVLDGGALKLSFSSPVSATNIALNYLNIGNVDSSKYYIVKFSLKGLKNNQSFPIYIQKSTSPWNILAPVQNCKIYSSRTENEFLFRVNKNEPNASLMIQLQEQDSTVWLDNVEFYEVNATPFNPDNHILFEYNATQSVKTVTLAHPYIDVKGNLYSGSVTLQPFTSIILLWATGVGINEYKNTTLNDLLVYPNPFNNSFYLKSDKLIKEVEAYNLMGQLLIQLNPNLTQVEINSDDLPKGVYILKVKINGNWISKKIIKQ